jgi:GT2 family glycosyltransferase
MLSFIRENSFLKQLLEIYNNNYAVMGSFMLFRKVVLDKANFFDPDFLMYCEELELCYRIISHGFKVHFDGNQKIIHAHRGSLTNYFKAHKKFYAL